MVGYLLISKVKLSFKKLVDSPLIPLKLNITPATIENFDSICNETLITKMVDKKMFINKL